MSGYYWIKLYHEVLDDPKMATLPDRLWRRVVELFLMAGRMGKTGHLPDAAQIAWMLRMDRDGLDMDLRQLLATGIIEKVNDGYQVVNFAKRQEALDPAERMRNMRERQKRDQYYNANVTDLLQNVTQINRLTESEVETEKTASTFSTFQDDPGLERIFTEVTSWMSIPSSYRADAIHALEIIRAKQDQPAEYLRPFFQEFKKRYNRSTGCFWLTEWAVTGNIPEQKNTTPKKKRRAYKDAYDQWVDDDGNPMTQEEVDKLYEP
jgi:hypothetical protein